MALGGLSVCSKDSGWGVSSVVSGIIEGWPSAINGLLSCSNIDGVGQKSRELLLVDVLSNQTQGAGRIVRGAEIAGFGPNFKILFG
jgi:hypothetical protein